MTFIADILLVAGALGAAFYCIVLSRRLSRFNDLEKGVGGAVAVLSAQVDDMTKTLERAREAASSSTQSLDALTVRAETVAGRLELMVASMHDLPDDAPPEEPEVKVEAAFIHAAATSESPMFVHRQNPMSQAAE